MDAEGRHISGYGGCLCAAQAYGHHGWMVAVGGGYEKDSRVLQRERVARVSAVAHGLDDRIRVASAAQ
jgi:hypothetical protein